MEISGLRLAAAGFILINILSVAVSVWQFVGAWRSATNHVGRGGRPVWAILAKWTLVLGILNSARLTTDTIVPQTLEWWSILAGDKTIPAYEIRVLPGGTDVEFYGGLRAGSARELERILDAVPQAKVLHINSVGGRLHEAGRMARLVRQRGLTTYTSDECLSAAALVFISGKERVVEARAKIGFHAGRLPGSTFEQRQQMNADMRDAMRVSGVSEEFINRVLATPHEQMWYPSVEEMYRARVITSQSFGERFVASGSLLRHSSFDDIDKIFSVTSLFRVVKEREPSLYQKMLNEFSAAIQAGQSEGEAINRASGLIESLAMSYLPRASDEALRRMRDFWVGVLEYFKDKDSRLGIAAFSREARGTNFNYNFGSLVPGPLVTNCWTAFEMVLLGASAQPAPQIRVAEADAHLTAIRSKLRVTYGEDLELLADETQWMQHSDRVCEMLLFMYRETQKLPVEDQGNLLRYLLSDDVSETSDEPER